MKCITRFLCLLVLLCSLSCTNCTTGSVRSAYVPLLSHMTVSLVQRDEDGDIGSFCTGVWVGETQILTAAHCVRDRHDVQYITQDVEPELFEEPWGLFVAHVERVDETHDLALLRGDIPYQHPSAILASVSPSVGDDITTVGSTLGLTWSVSGGNVGAYRVRLRYVTKTEGPFMQIVSAAYFGNSGGPVFDLSGRLCGIVIEKTPAPTVMLAVHRATIARFLEAQ